MFVKLALFALFAAAVCALPVDEKKPEEDGTQMASISRALKELEAQGVVEDIRNFLGQFFEDDNTVNVNGEERTRKKKKMETVALLLVVLGATLLPLILGGLALVAGKALVVSKLALVIGLVLGLKKILSQKKEVIVEQAHPPSHGWGRASGAQNLAYNAYAPQ